MATINLKLTGLTCDMCIKSVTNIVKLNDHVKDVKVELTSATIEVDELTPELTQELISEITDIGYEASSV